MRRTTHGLARAGKALLPAIVCVFLLSLVLAAGGHQPADGQGDSIGGVVHPSGSANTRVYVTGVNTMSQVQGGYFVLRGYVTVANVSDPPNWDPWPSVAIALRMNGSFIYQSPVPGDLVLPRHQQPHGRELEHLRGRRADPQLQLHVQPAVRRHGCLQRERHCQRQHPAAAAVHA
jgi:hypothetical protein